MGSASLAVATDGGSPVAGNLCVVCLLMRLLCAGSSLADRREGASLALQNSCCSSLCMVFSSGEKDLMLNRKLPSRLKNVAE